MLKAKNHNRRGRNPATTQWLLFPFCYRRSANAVTAFIALAIEVSSLAVSAKKEEILFTIQKFKLTVTTWFTGTIPVNHHFNSTMKPGRLLAAALVGLSTEPGQ